METEESGSVQQICENLELVKGFAITLILFELKILFLCTHCTVQVYCLCTLIILLCFVFD